MPTRKTFFWLSAALVMYLIAWNIGSGWLYIITTLFIAFPLLSLGAGRFNTLNLEIQQSAEESSISGGYARSNISVINNSRFPRFFLSIDCCFGGARQSFFVPTIKGGRRHEEQLVLEGLKRGIYPGAEITITSSAPIGLVKSRRKKTTNCPLIVYPSWQRLSSDWDTGHLHTGSIRSSSLPTRSTTSDYLGVRDYRPEDSPRSIHWRTTARYNQLMVVEYARHAAISPVLILDTWKGMGEANDAFEAVVSAAASLAVREDSNHRRFGIGLSPSDATARGLGHDSVPALFWLAGVEAQAEHPPALDEHLPWPEVTPVLLLSSHTANRNVHQSRLLEAHPHTVIVIFDIRGFGRDMSTRSDLMNDVELAALAYDLTRTRSRLLVIDNADKVSSCLESL